MKKKALKLKDEYKGLSITRNNHQIGTITFNTLIVPEMYWHNFYNIGFEFMFDLVDVPEVVKAKIKHSSK